MDPRPSRPAGRVRAGSSCRDRPPLPDALAPEEAQAPPSGPSRSRSQAAYRTPEADREPGGCSMLRCPMPLATRSKGGAVSLEGGLSALSCSARCPDRERGCRADGAAISSSSCRTITAGGIGSGRPNTFSGESTDCPTVNLTPASCRAAAGSGPLSAASRMLQASAPALSGLTSTTGPRLSGEVRLGERINHADGPAAHVGVSRPQCGGVAAGGDQNAFPGRRDREFSLPFPDGRRVVQDCCASKSRAGQPARGVHRDPRVRPGESGETALRTRGRPPGIGS